MTNTKEKNWISLDYFEVTSCECVSHGPSYDPSNIAFFPVSDGNSTGLLTPSATPTGTRASLSCLESLLNYVCDQTSLTASSSANPKEASVALIVGASLGGLVIVLLLACLVPLLLRRRQKFTSEPILPQCMCLLFHSLLLNNIACNFTRWQSDI